MAYMTAKKRKQVEDRCWCGILQKIEQELQRRKQRRQKSRATKLLETLRQKALKRDGAAMIELAKKYVPLTRTLPPGVYAFGPVGAIYLDGERLAKGTRCSTLQLGIVHAQIYR